MEYNGNWIVHIGQGGDLRNWKGLEYGRYRISVTGALFGIGRKLYDKIGGLPELYRLSCEDADYCLSAWSNGYRVWYEPGLRAVHQEGGSRGATPSSKSEKNPKWVMWEEESLEIFSKRLKTTDMDSLVQEVEKANKEEYEDGGITVINRRGALGDVLCAAPVIQRYAETHKDFVYVSTIRPEPFRDMQGKLQGLVDHPEKVAYDKLLDLDWAYERVPKVGIRESFEKVLGVEKTGRPELFSNLLDLHEAQIIFPRLRFDNLVVVHMARTWRTKTWPRENWGDLVARFVNSGHDVAVVGAGVDFRVHDSGKIFNLAGQEGQIPLNIHQIHAVISKAKLFVGMDSGIMHVALATTTPVVGMFTVADPKQVIQYKRPGKSKFLSPVCECRYCLHRETPPVTNVECSNPQYLLCMKQLEPKVVFDECKKLLQ